MRKPTARKKHGSPHWAIFTLLGLLTAYLVESRMRRRSSVLVKEIEERRKDQETIHKQLAQLTAIYDTAPIGLCCLDIDMRYLSINRLLAGMNGRSVEDHIGRTIRDLHPELFPILDPVLQGVIATGQPALNIEIHGRTAQHGRARDFLASYYPLRNAAGQIVGINVVVEDITEQKAAQAAILTSLREKALLLKEIHHRTKNNLQIISSLLRLHAAAQPIKQPDNMFEDLQGRIHSMALIHEQLYQSGSFSDIDTDQYVHALVTHITRSFGASNVSFVISTHDLAWNPDIAMNCGLMLNELLTNAFKYAFPAGEGEIRVSISREGQSHIIMVQDSGIGLPEGFSLDNVTSLGLQLVTTLAKQLGGTIEFSRQNGTKFTIRFPVPSSE